MTLPGSRKKSTLEERRGTCKAGKAAKKHDPDGHKATYVEQERSADSTK